MTGQFNPESNRRLVRTPSPALDESPWGYLLRLTYANGYPSPWFIGRLCGLDQSSIRRLHFDLSPIAKVTGHIQSVLETVSYPRHNNRTCRLQGQVVNDFDVNPRLARVCPQCLQNGFVLSSFNDLVHVGVCRHHLVHLVTHCPRCERRLTAYRPGPALCPCGYDLRECEPTPCTNPDMQLGTAFLAAAYAREALQTIAPDQTPSALPNPLTTSLRTANRLISTFYALDPDTPKRAAADMHTTLLAHTGATLREWPDSFFRLLDGCQSRAPARRSRSSSLADRFQSVYRRLLKDKVAPDDLGFIRKAFLAYVEGSNTATYLDTRTRGYNSNRTRWLSITQTADALGIHRRTVSEMIAAKELITRTVTAGQRQRVLIDSQGPGFPRTKNNPPIELRKAGKALGMPASVLRTLIERGALNAYVTPGRRRCFTSTGIADLLQDLCGVPTKRKSAVNATTINLTRFLIHGHARSHAKADVLAAVLTGRISPIMNGHHLNCLVFERADIRSVVAHAHQEDTILSASEAADVIGCQDSIIPSLAEYGYLKIARFRNSWGIERREVDRFTKRMIPVTVLAQRLQVSAARARRYCRQYGFRVISIPRASPSAQYGQPFVEATPGQRERLLGSLSESSHIH